VAFVSLVLLFFMTVVSDFQCKSNKWKSENSTVQCRVREQGSRQQVLASPSRSSHNKDAFVAGVHGDHSLNEKWEILKS